MRKHLTEPELKEMAMEVASSIVIRSYDHGNSVDTRRASTDKEKDIIFKVAYGALLTLNYGETNRGNKVAERAVIDAAEMTVDLFLPGANGYLTIYNPLWMILSSWEKE